MTTTLSFCFFFFNDTATTEIYTLSLHDALPIFAGAPARAAGEQAGEQERPECAPDYGRFTLIVVPLLLPSTSWFNVRRSEEHTSELQSQSNLVCRLLLEKKNSVPRTSSVALTMT